jgi:hypothetical protein
VPALSDAAGKYSIRCAKVSKCHFCGQGTRIGSPFPLEFRLHGDSDVRSRIDFLLLIGPEKIELACDRDACAHTDLERLETGISHLRTSAVLAVLNDGIV